MFQLNIHGLSNEKHTLDICEDENEFKNMTILQLKEKLKQLENDFTLGYYKIEHRSTIMSVHRMPGGLRKTSFNTIWYSNKYISIHNNKDYFNFE